MGTRLARAFLVLGILLLISSAAFAQGSGGVLTGRVTDETGAALPGVTVTATNASTGYNRTAVTGPDGVYRFPSLPPGTYSVVSDLSGFNTVTTRDVSVNVSTEREINVTLKAASVKEQITVTAEAPLVANTPSIGTTVSQRELENLPLNGRQFANLGSLAPGTSLAVNPDPTKPGQLTIAVNGGIGRNVNYMIDGGDNMDDTIGGALQNFNLEAVQEFTIQTQSYKAEYGRSSGGVLTVVTKTGTNDLGGSAYGFFRDDSLNEKTEAERRANADKAPYKRKQYGASLGGPIVRDRAHFFGTYEKTDRPQNYTVNTSGLFPDFDGRSFGIPFTDELRTAKATANISSAQFLQVRYGYQKNSDKYGAGALILPSALGTLTNEYESWLGGHTWTISGSKLNEFVYQWTRFENGIFPDSTEPALLFPNGVSTGQNVNSPQTTIQEKSQFKDDFSWSTNLFGDRRNDFKAGLNYIHEPILGGTFTTGTAGQFELLNNTPNSPVRRIVITGGFAGFSTPVEQYSGYFQDDLYVNSRLTINAGIRYDVWTGFDLDQSGNTLFQALKNNTKYNDAVYYNDFRGWDGRLENDTDNVSPRLGFTYDISGNGRQVLRGGIGRYYDFPYTNATILFPSEAVQSNFGTVYQFIDPNGIKNPDGSFFKPGQTLPPNQAPPLGNPLPNEVAAPSVTNVPYSDQVSLGYSTQLTNNIGVTIDAVTIRYRDIPFRFRFNGALDENGKPSSSLRFPQFANTRMWIGDGEADYDALNLGVRARLAQRFELQGFYTLARAEGNVLAGADEFRITDRTYGPGLASDQSINFRDPYCDACFGPLNTDARHRVTLSGVYTAPFEINVSGVFRYKSATPYWDRYGDDADSDGFTNDLAPGADHVNSLRGESNSQFDLRLAKDFRIVRNFGVELIAELFNVFNEENPAFFRGQRFVVANASQPRGNPARYAPNQTYRQPSRFAGDPLQGEQRLIQLGARIRF